MSEKMYILDPEHHLVVVDDEKVWHEWHMDTNNRRVAYTSVSDAVEVSTVFLLIDHQFGDGPPVLFETLIFGGSLDGEMWRYSSWDEAIKGHEEAVKKATEAKSSVLDGLDVKGLIENLNKLDPYLEVNPNDTVRYLIELADFVERKE